MGDFECESERLLFYPPELERDSEVYELFNDAETMLPHLQILFGISEVDLTARREQQRLGWTNGSSRYLDVVEKASGAFVGVAGFRLVDREKETAEFGIIITSAHQRKGFASEVYKANIHYADSELKCTTIAAATKNPIMLTFLGKRGMTVVEQNTGSNDEWIRLEGRTKDILKVCL